MSKNLGQYKQELQTRECLVQAIYQYIFNATSLNLLIEQFLAENTPKKIKLLAAPVKYPSLGGFDLELIGFEQ